MLLQHLLNLRNHEFSNLEDQPQEAKYFQELATILYCRMEKKQERRRHVDTRNDAKCSEVITALKPTTGTNAARSVPSITCKMIHGSESYSSGQTLWKEERANQRKLMHSQGEHMQCRAVKNNDQLQCTRGHALG
jgi:hypothetical protein